MTNIRQLNILDLPKAARMADSVYPQNLWEAAEVFENKLNIFPLGCLGYFLDDAIQGYVFSHPWYKDKIVGLNQTIVIDISKTDCYYIHDLAVSQTAHKTGIGTILAKETFKIAQQVGFKEIRLVSVNNSKRFWEKLGFENLGQFKYTNDSPAFKMVKIL